KAAQIQALRARQDRTARHLRLLTQQLRPPILAHFGLVKALRAQVEQMRTVYEKPEIEIVTPAEPLELEDDISLELYRICQQALQNALQHANARHIRIRLWTDAESVWLEVEDDGDGFAGPVQWLELARSGHFGMIGMLERAEALGGHLTVRSVPNEGTLIQVQAPLTRPTDTQFLREL
ncbi:MAG TPA: ATP-binding protein, partial [Caldilineaceae bacterium]|nr:ATP-binding protein [Caldilineaceae bacterium]